MPRARASRFRSTRNEEYMRARSIGTSSPIFKVDRPWCHRGSYPAVTRVDESSLSFRFVTGPTIGGHLIPNSDCTPPGYHERGPSSKRVISDATTVHQTHELATN